MKKLLHVCMLVSCAMISTASFAKANEQSLDQMVAVVNDDVITKSELNHALDSAKMQLTQEHVAIPAASVLQKQVLDKLINKKVQLQLARQAGLKVTDEELNKAVATVASENHMSVSALYERINADGMSTTEYRTEMHDQILMQKLQQQEVASKVTITPQEVSNFLHSRNWQQNGTNEYHLEDILIPLPDAPTSEQIIAAKQHADQVYAELRQGKSFNSIAQSESGGSRALQGGDLGWRKLPEIPSAFAAEAVRMHPNDVAGLIQAPNGFHIIRLMGLRALSAKNATPDSKAVESLLLQQKFEEAVQNWASKVRSQAFVTTNLA